MTNRTGGTCTRPHDIQCVCVVCAHHSCHLLLRPAREVVSEVVLARDFCVYCIVIELETNKLIVAQCSAVQYSTVQYSTVQYSTVQYSTVQYSTVQYSTVQYSTVQYST